MTLFLIKGRFLLAGFLICCAVWFFLKAFLIETRRED